MMPSRNTSSSMVETCCAVCCHLPRGSVKRRSTYSTECSLSISITLPTLLVAPAGFLAISCCPVLMSSCQAAGDPRGSASHETAEARRRLCARGFPRQARLVGVRRGPEAAPGPAGGRRSRRPRPAQIASSPRSPVRMRITSSTEEMKILPSPIRPVRAAVDDRFHRALDDAVLADHLDLHLGQEVDHVFGAAIQLGMAFLPAEALGLDDRDALQPDLVQRFLHLVQLERLDDSLDLLHLRHRPG